MTKKSPRIYLYKITFDEVPYYYYGIKKEKYYNQKYFGSPITHKWAWKFYTPKKQILEFFEYSDEGWLKALEIEKRLIKPFFNDKWCLNENVGGVFSLQSARKVGKEHFKNGTGAFSLSKEERTKLSKQIVKNNKKNKVGIFSMSEEQILDAAKMGGRKSFETKTGIFSLTEQQKKEINQKLKEEKKGIYSISGERRKEIGRISGQNSFKNKTGVFGISDEDKQNARKMGGKVTSQKLNSQKWKCLVTGYITTPGPLTQYQKIRGIDTSKRERIE